MSDLFKSIITLGSVNWENKLEIASIFLIPLPFLVFVYLLLRQALKRICGEKNT